ncbi:relaxin receptor 2-like [Littorina saxatilis]|uniref:relaxin receptor 2-like n=1 Tax=Littorina saxatilis TaxID=31220 RepID=UPI0038B4B4EA
MLFSFHPEGRPPEKLGNGLFNCSVDHYPTFRQHLDCNLEPECHGGQDETQHCPFSSPACEGKVASGDRCFVYVSRTVLTEFRTTQLHAYDEMRRYCRQLGGSLVTIRSEAERVEFVNMFQTEYASDCAFPGNNVTLSDWKGRSIHPETVASVGMFLCDDGVTRIPFSLVCDFRSDCEDDSDELFCKHPVCDGFQCANGQCVEYLMRCDLLSDCVDGSDEDGCFDSSYTEVVGPTPKPPGIITLDGKGSFSFIAIKPNESCPTTHYRCPGEMDYCLPVYTRCNGFYDCLGREDEESCEEATCPGFYRCRASSVCVHPDHLCDGWPQCPQRDDELFCNMTCPEGCMCQGRASVCRQPLSVSSFLELRYVDAGGSRMTLSDADGVVYLIHLSLASCGLTRLTSLHLPNLRYMDLSHNSLQTINMTVFLSVLNLKTLTLAGNPLNNLYSAPSGLQHTTLSTIDLSKTSLELFESKPFSDFLALRHLNLSHTKIRTIGRDGFHFTQSVNNLDLTGSPVAYFEADLYQGLENIENIRSDNYKLCCERLLPSHFPKQSCFAPQDEISTCEDLLPSATYRGCLWLIGFMSVAGNAIGFAMRTCVQKTFLKSGFAMFVIHLSLSDFLMGVYMAIVGVADELFRGNYLFYDLTWTQSVGCKVAGFLSLLSNEVSALIILLITFDRFIVIRFPFSQFRFGKYSASAACLAAWTVGVVLAAIPLLPVTAHWEFYSQTGICIPLPVTRQDFQGRGYSLGVVVVLNFILFLLVAAGQAVIFWSVKQNTMTTSESSNKSRDMAVARRLITVALTDFFCWFPIGVCGLLALAGVPIPGEVNVAMAIFVLPINSALNPFLYTLNMIAEKRHRKSEEKLLRLLESVSEMASCPL